ncbi:MULTISPECIES: ABC transporter ATP-binding protein [unclassified Streptomyces]|uniref:ABC transporter ATP-binding protein n=1 Tax=unclassified Streptomyces TaxID=2593676 RepID=UPI00224FC2EC|nr:MULTISPECIES: ABC transporter ATP-binding protein [unclassified Streptomyces]MCX5049198.1 ABC transporter ATP-binding protein [Streptomyces sp. NBC_00474]MCX5056049.1 ABC transporter ATP-binding protein [Streptomyces sp. NBC_00452]MCX5247054.1 ABC transporter ATP-binding protein [Streptomyces sp. NBC_00201]MCX5287153.1 ABC transporter ATP-binding protein [Streptomyces sp. NBC_00183]
MSSTSTIPAVALEASGLGKRYGRRAAAALDDCSFRLPAGRISALVGPNGAGKSTLLALAAGLLRPTAGTLTVFGRAPGEFRDRVAFLAQNKPLYPQLTIADTLRMGAELNPSRWDAAYASRIVEEGSLGPAQKIRGLSGGQRTRVALALALGKRPDLMLLDEPMADLDPLARHELMGTLMADAAERGTTVLMSSHIVSELADACDHLLLLGGGRIRLGGGIDDLLNAHTLVTGRGTPADLAPHTVVESRAAGRGLTALIRRDGPVDGTWETEEPSLEELLLAHLRSPDAPALLTPGTTAAPVEVRA